MFFSSACEPAVTRHVLFASPRSTSRCSIINNQSYLTGPVTPRLLWRRGRICSWSTLWPCSLKNKRVIQEVGGARADDRQKQCKHACICMHAFLPPYETGITRRTYCFRIVQAGRKVGRAQTPQRKNEFPFLLQWQLLKAPQLFKARSVFSHCGLGLDLQETQQGCHFNPPLFFSQNILYYPIFPVLRADPNCLVK